MDRFMVIYYNGRGNRDRYFTFYEDAVRFKKQCGDDKATIWKEITNG